MRLGLALLLVTTAVTACDCGPAPSPTRSERQSARRPERPRPDGRGCLPDVEPVPDRVQQGVCLAHNWQARGARGYGTDASRGTLEELRALGVEWLSITPFAFMRSLDDPEVRLIGDHAGGERDEVVVAQIAQAREAGMRVLLKPHIWIGGGAYRGDIELRDDDDWARWLASYRRFALHYARMAAEHDVAILAVGVELDSIVARHPSYWRALVAEVREVYDGELVYSANWDQVLDFPLWEAFDYVGIQFYPPLADEPGMSEEALRERMEHYASVLDDFHARVDRPILFTEVGYRSVRDGELRPHGWPEHDRGDPTVDEATQAMAYALFLEAMGNEPWTAGIYWWKWFTDPATDEEGPAGFSPRGKLAEAVLRSAYAASCR